MALVSAEPVAVLAAWARRKQGSAQCGFARDLTFADLLEFSKYRCQVPRAAKGERPTPMRPTWPRCDCAAGRCLGINGEKGACQRVRRRQGSSENNQAILNVGKWRVIEIG